MLPESERIKTVICSLREPGLRTAFLRDYLGQGDDPVRVSALDELCACAARGNPDAREAALAVAMLLAALAEDPLLDRVGRTAAVSGLAALGRLLRRAPELTPRDEVPARLPEYARDRELSLGERRMLARRPTRSQFDKLLRDPHPLVITQLLENPLVTENDVVRLAALRPTSGDVQRAIARTPWLCRPRVRMALIQNPNTPSAVAVPLVAACTSHELLTLARSNACAVIVRSTAKELLQERELGEPEPRSPAQPSSSSPSSQLSSAPSVTLEAHCSQRGGSS
ncbi:MAG TPA: hypothetical protein VIM73_05880 [Polyangiaceae bacterium]